MVVLGGGGGLMSEVPLYPKSQPRKQIREQREGCRKMLGVLSRATSVLNEVSALDA